jgi:CheY-like chemotaxis protein
MSKRVLVAVDDIFFSSKIAETAKHLNIPLLFARSQDEVIARALTEKPSLLIVDLNSNRCNPLETIGQIKEDPDLRHIPVVGFLSHVQADLKVKATMAGCDRVLPRSVFTTHLPEILAEYTADSR